jgi:Bacterial Ig domain
VTTDEDTPTGFIPFTVGDGETAAGSLDVTAQSSNQTLLPNGAIERVGSGSNRALRLTPAANQHGGATIDVAVSDGTLTTHETFLLTVTSVDDAPVAKNDSYSVGAVQPLTVLAASGVLANDTDVEGSPLSAAVVTGPAHGSLALRADGGFTYTPLASFAGTDSFTYRASDGSATSSPATVTVTVVASDCSPRPRVVPSPAAGGGKLNVHVEATPLNSQRNNPLQHVIFDKLDNAKVAVNGQAIAEGFDYQAPANTIGLDFVVQRVTVGQAATVRFTVVDGCGAWHTFVGGGPGAAF